MKNVYLFFIASFLFTSVMGQSTKTQKDIANHNINLISDFMQTDVNNAEHQKAINGYIAILKRSLNHKDSKTLKQSLDSTLNDNAYPDKYEYLYDAFGNYITFIDYSNGPSGIIPYSKKEYTYDNQHNLLKLEIFDYNQDHEWVLHYESETTYDVKNNLTEHKSWGSWEDKLTVNDRFEFVYNEDNLLIESFAYSWNETNNLWLNKRKTENIYNENMDFSETTSYAWDTNNEWIWRNKTNYTYDNDYLILKLYTYSYLPPYGYDYSYNDENLLSTLISFSVEEDININNFRSDFFYDNLSNLINQTNYNWNETNNDWKAKTRKEYFFDDLNNLTKIINYDTYNNTNELAYGSKQEYTYDNTYTYEDLLLPIIPENSAGIWFFSSSNKPEVYYNHLKTQRSYYSWNDETAEWRDPSKTFYYYSDHFVDNIDVIPFDKVNTYPNPTNDLINFEISNNFKNATAILYNIQGQKVLEQGLDAGNQISIKHLDAGLYFYTITQNSIILSGKILKE